MQWSLAAREGERELVPAARRAPWLFSAAVNQLARPIGRLIVAAERVRGGDLSTRVQEGSADDEVASLSRAFNRMTAQLKISRDELENYNRTLEQRVELRTAELARHVVRRRSLDRRGLHRCCQASPQLSQTRLGARIGLRQAGVDIHDQVQLAREVVNDRQFLTLQ